MSEAQRGWIYRVSLAVLVVAGIYGLVNEEQAAGWGALVLALTGNGLAALNTSVSGSSEG
jgi:hypothetical protein